MNQSFKVSIFTFCLLIFSVVGCTSSHTPTPSKPHNASVTAPQPQSSPALPGNGEKPSEEITKLMNRVGTILESKSVNFDEFQKTYDGRLATYVREVDAAYQTSLDKDVCQAVEKLKTGKDKEANIETVVKSIQRAFIITFQKSLATLKKGPSEPSTLSKLLQAAPAARVVTQRRSLWLDKGTEFPDTFDASLERLKKAVHEKNTSALAEAAGQLDFIFTKCLVLSVFFELDGLVKERGKDADEASGKRVEASLYYASLREGHEKRNKSAAATISEQFTHSPGQIDVDLIRSLLKVDFKPELADVDPSKLGS